MGVPYRVHPPLRTEDIKKDPSPYLVRRIQFEELADRAPTLL